MQTDWVHGKLLFAEKCAACHGAAGKGAGPASLGLGLPPPDLTSLAAKNGGAFPREYVMGMIDGYDRRAQIHAPMPEFGAEGLGQIVRVENGDQVLSAPTDLIAITEYLRIIQEP